ncbi:PIG-L family deacetylase [Litorivicinus sp.]|nr:PIG-L family deacetylase [Litorivicinus sp.]MDC1239981.1 PIG-L family deacetylase [Litorivicinus sp.]
MTVVMVAAPHPDDETLGCGGTLLRHRAEGDEVHWLIMSRISVEMGYDQDKVSSRSLEIESVSRAYGCSSVHQAPFDATSLDTYSKRTLVNCVSEYVNKITPEIVYLPNYQDAHSDHGVVFDAISACVKQFRYPFVKKVRMYEVLSETEFGMRIDGSGFRPNLWVDISAFLEQKIKIAKIYKSEMGVHPFPRSESALRALACLRGARAGVDAAEGFVTLEEIE